MTLNCEVLNDEFLSQLPFSLKSITIDKLEFTVSFSSVMNDGCHFNIDGLSIDIVPNEYKHTGKFKDKSDINHNNEPTTENMWVYSQTDEVMLNKQIMYTPGFLKTFEELIVKTFPLGIVISFKIFVPT